jgi:hypothetical protein
VCSAPDQGHGELVSRDEQVLDDRGQVREALEPLADPADWPGHADVHAVRPQVLAEDVAGHREVSGPPVREPPPGDLQVPLAGLHGSRLVYGPLTALASSD